MDFDAVSFCRGMREAAGEQNSMLICATYGKFEPNAR